jgi:hypothetical protein
MLLVKRSVSPPWYLRHNYIQWQVYHRAELFARPLLRDKTKEVVMCESSRESPTCPSGKSSIYMKMCTMHWWYNIDKGWPKFSKKNVPIATSSITHCTWTGPRSKAGYDLKFRRLTAQTMAQPDTFKLLKTKRNLLYIRNQSVPRCKHFPPRL